MNPARELHPTDDDLREGFFAHQVRTNFRNLCRMIGFERARAVIAEIILSEDERTKA